jgi:hypothetical protein
MKNHWIDLYRQKKARWWSIEFSRNGSFLLKRRRVEIPDSDKVFGAGNSNTQTSIAVMFIHKTTDNELLGFLKESKKDMSGMYARARLQYGIYPFLVEMKNHELTGLSYYKVFPGQNPVDVWFSFRFNHLRTYTT